MATAKPSLTCDSPRIQVEYIGLGFGGVKTTSGLEQSVYINATTAKLRTLEYCHDSEAGS